MTNLTWTPYDGNGGFVATGPDIGGTIFSLQVKLKYDDRTWWPIILNNPPGQIGSQAAYGPNLPTVSDAMKWLSEKDADQLLAYWEEHQ